MFASKIRTKAIVRYALVASRAEPQCGHGTLSLLLRGRALRVLLLLSVFGLAFRLGLLFLFGGLLLFFLLGRFRFRGLLLGLGVLFRLRRLFVLSWLGLFFLRRRFRRVLLFHRLRLLFVLRRLRLILLFRFGVFIRVLVLRVTGDRRSEQQEQRRGANDSEYFHECCLHYRESIRPALIAVRIRAHCNRNRLISVRSVPLTHLCAFGERNERLQKSSTTRAPPRLPLPRS